MLRRDDPPVAIFFSIMNQANEQDHGLNVVQIEGRFFDLIYCFWVYRVGF
jgi:hypothetical protein